MSLWNSTAAITARSVLRKLGLASPLIRLLGSHEYEAAFNRALFAALRPGDTVWDIGANVGLYTRKFAEAVGPSGHVFAFEPSPINVKRLGEATSEFANITIVPVALGASRSTAAFTEGEDEMGAISRISIGGEAQDVEVPVECADDVIAEGKAAVPNMLKLDVEGFEFEVLKGMPELLASPPLRTLCIEVHFGLLQKRGMRNGPKEIERLLTKAGFGITWTDPSHIVATKSR